jgi:hypothetical protein
MFSLFSCICGRHRRCVDVTVVSDDQPETKKKKVLQSVNNMFNPVYTDSVWLGGGGGLLSPVGDHILQEFNTLYLTRFKTYKIARPSQTKT